MMGLLTVLSLTLLLSRALPTHGFLTVETIHDTPTYHTTETKDADVRVVYEAVRSSCHAEGRVFQCMPPFTNVAEGATVEATSTCGTVDSTEQFCIPRTDNTGRTQLHCEPCTPPDRFHAGHLTDRHQMHNETYWVSGAVSPGQTVNLTMSLGKTFEVYYISLQPYGRLPDAITLSKSSDFGKTWQPWQYFSTDCYRAFRLPTSNEHNAQISAANIQEVLCVALKPSETHETLSHAAKMIAFSTTIGRPSSQPWSAGLVDWMTMTDLKVTLARFHDQHLDSTQHDAGGLLLTPNLLTPANVFRVGDADRSKMASGTLGMSRHQFQSDATTRAAMKSMHFAFSDLAIGGRCKCNGHANRCVRDRVPDSESKDQNEWGPLRCDCQHNTAGTDCEKCAPGHLDRPWARASSEAVNECKRCDCNLHSSSCVFSQQLYLMSLKTSGGVCQDCLHNTVGRKCHHCASGYYRDWTKPISHDQVCLDCRCHPIGSIANKPCDRKTGQCPCKPGVTGQACNRCQEGYKQTRLSEQPCIKANEHFAYRRKNVPESASSGTIHTIVPENSPECPSCRAHKKRIRFKNFCRREAVFLGTIETHKLDKDKIRFEVRIQETWRVDGVAGRLLPKKASVNLPPFPIWAKIQESVLTNSRGQKIRCLCPDFKPGEVYLFLTQSYQVPNDNRMELMLDSQSIVLPWRESWRRRLNRFVRRAAKGRCRGMTQDNGPHTNSARIRRVQRLRTAPGYYAANFNPDQIVGDGPLRRTSMRRAPVSRPSASQPFQQLASDQATNQGHRSQSNQPQFTYYNPYMAYDNSKKY